MERIEYFTVNAQAEHLRTMEDQISEILNEVRKIDKLSNKTDKISERMDKVSENMEKVCERLEKVEQDANDALEMANVNRSDLEFVKEKLDYLEIQSRRNMGYPKTKIRSPRMREENY